MKRRSRQILANTNRALILLVLVQVHEGIARFRYVQMVFIDVIQIVVGIQSGQQEDVCTPARKPSEQKGPQAHRMKM